MRFVSFAHFFIASSLSAAIVFPGVNVGPTLVGTSSALVSLNFTFSSQNSPPVFSLLYGGEFTLGTITCNSGNTICSVEATFTPKYPGLRTDIVIARDAANIVQGRLPLSGVGTGAQASVAPGVVTQILPSNRVYTVPSAFVLDTAGNAYMIAFQSNQVFRMSATDQSVTIVAGMTTGGYSGDGGPAINAQFNQPNSLALDQAGNLFVADRYNNVIRKVDLATGIVTTAVGNGTAGFSDSGSATQAELNQPSSLAIDPFGNLYFLDSGNYDSVTDYKVHMVSATTQTISVFAGTGVEGNTGDGGPAISAEIDPLSLSSDANGNIYIVQQSGNYDDAGGAVRVVSGGTISHFAGSESGQTGDGGPAISTYFYDILSVSFDAGGSIYFVDGATG